MKHQLVTRNAAGRHGRVHAAGKLVLFVSLAAFLTAPLLAADITQSLQPRRLAQSTPEFSRPPKGVCIIHTAKEIRAKRGGMANSRCRVCWPGANMSESDCEKVCENPFYKWFDECSSKWVQGRLACEKDQCFSTPIPDPPLRLTLGNWQYQENQTKTCGASVNKTGSIQITSKTGDNTFSGVWEGSSRNFSPRSCGFKYTCSQYSFRLNVSISVVNKIANIHVPGHQNCFRAHTKRYTITSPSSMHLSIRNGSGTSITSILNSLSATGPAIASAEGLAPNIEIPVMKGEWELIQETDRPAAGKSPPRRAKPRGSATCTASEILKGKSGCQR